MHHDDEPEAYLARLRHGPGLVLRGCPDCPAIFAGLDDAHAAELLAIHREAACQGEVTAMTLAILHLLTHLHLLIRPLMYHD